MIRKAVIDDIPFVEQVYNEALASDDVVNFTQWIKGLYPTVKTAEKALNAGTLFVHIDKESGEITGAVILNHEQPEEYKKLDWTMEATGDEVLVVHTLCIKPSFSCKGIGQEFMGFAETYARKLGCRVIRLDTNDKNIPGAKLYKKMGYTHVGNADFNFQGLEYQNLKCFDKAL